MVGAHSRNLLMGTKAETMKEHCLLACQLWFAQVAFLYNPDLETALPAGG